MTTAQYKAIESHIAFWGALFMFNVTESKWANFAFFVVMIFQMVRNLYWHSQTVKAKQ